ncbi:maspardin-like [Oppia nitens]|uniref:maspardin-like n=1 Tax=Oppia nitens TaxID=1686743 RepID=UPI0023D97AAE|nr:maspardin-like [Oppia nitens]
MVDKVLNLLSPKLERLANISLSTDYQHFRSNVSLKKVIVDDDSSKVWSLYDCGPKTVTSPLICLPPVSGTADVFFRLLIDLSAKGYRVISAEYPVYWTVREFVNGFSRLLDHMNLERVHVLGASLGGFLAQKFAESTYQSHRIQSLILVNSFADTSVFNHTESAVMFWMTPSALLKKLVMGSSSMITTSKDDQYIIDAIEFMSERLDTLPQPELASRLTLNCISCYVEPQRLNNIDITLLDVFDQCALSQSVREELYKLYPDARRAHLKTGGNFPYLSRWDDVIMHIVVHLRPFQNTKYSAYSDHIELATQVMADDGNGGDDDNDLHETTPTFIGDNAVAQDI